MNTTGLRFLGAALLMLFAVWAGLKLHSYSATRDGTAVAVGRASAPGPQDTAPGAQDSADTLGMVAHSVPPRLPEFALNDLSGRHTAISHWRGKSLMINFWATWCAPCRREIPLLKALATDWAGRDLTVVGIAVDYPNKVQDFVNRFQIDYPVLVGEQDALEVAAEFGMDSPAFPFTVFTDNRGELVALYVGELHRPQADFILSEVESLNLSRTKLVESRRRIADGLRRLGSKQIG